MEECPRDPRRHKRPFSEMSHSATLSPSPISLGGSAPSNLQPSYRRPSIPASENTPSLSRGRSTSHPHNNPSQRAPPEMSERVQPQQRPHQQIQASQLIIDLTNDVDVVEESMLPGLDSHGGFRHERPTALGRGDVANLEGFIDLTEEEGEVIFTGQRELAPTLRRPETPHLGMSFTAALLRRQHFPPFAAAERGRASSLARLSHMIPHFVDHIPALFHTQINDGLGQAMPQMDYGRGAFDRKPDHVPPPAARDHFTRSPTEHDTIICPSCEEELVHHKEIEGPPLKKGGKASSKKDREVHPFWVVKECGHVYCNRCFQNRGEKFSNTKFSETAKPSSSRKDRKSILCAVEDCDCEVKGKDRWVGVFL